MFALNTAKQSVFAAAAESERARLAVTRVRSPSESGKPASPDALPGTDDTHPPICIFFAMGGCTRGSRCPFSHELRQDAPAGVDVSAGYYITGKVANYRAGSSATPVAAAAAAVPCAQLGGSDEAPQSSCGSTGPSLASSPTANTSSLVTRSAVSIGTEARALTNMAPLPPPSRDEAALLPSSVGMFSLLHTTPGPAMQSSSSTTTPVPGAVVVNGHSAACSLPGPGLRVGDLFAHDERRGVAVNYDVPSQSMAQSLTWAPTTPPGGDTVVVGHPSHSVTTDQRTSTVRKYAPRYTLRQAAFYKDEVVVLHNFEQDGSEMEGVNRVMDGRNSPHETAAAVTLPVRPQGLVSVANAARCMESMSISVRVQPAVAPQRPEPLHGGPGPMRAPVLQPVVVGADAKVRVAQPTMHPAESAHVGTMASHASLAPRRGVAPSPQNASHATEVCVGARPVTSATPQTHVPLQRGGATHIQVPAPRTRMAQQRQQQQRQQQSAKQEPAVRFVAPQPRSMMAHGATRNKPLAATASAEPGRAVTLSSLGSAQMGAPRRETAAVTSVAAASLPAREQLVLSASPMTHAMAGARPDVVPADALRRARQDDVPRFAPTITLGGRAAPQLGPRTDDTQLTLQPRSQTGPAPMMLPASQLLYHPTATTPDELARPPQTASSLQPHEVLCRAASYQIRGAATSVHQGRDGEGAGMAHPVVAQDGGTLLQPYAVSAGQSLVPVMLLSNGSTLFTPNLQGVDGVTYTPVKAYMGGNFVLVGHSGSLNSSNNNRGALVGAAAPL